MEDMMSITISEAELLGMPEHLLLDLRSYLNNVRGSQTPGALRAQSDAGMSVERHGPDLQAAEDGPERWRFDDHGLTISETPPGQFPAGLRIEQALEDGAGRAYIALQWRLNSQLKEIVDLALGHGFDKLWRINHPREAHFENNHKYKTGVRHIAFSRSHTERWVFAVDVVNSKPPDVRAVVFEKHHQGTIEGVLGKELPRNEPARPGGWKGELGGGKNILVDPSDLVKILEKVNQ